MMLFAIRKIGGIAVIFLSALPIVAAEKIPHSVVHLAEPKGDAPKEGNRQSYFTLGLGMRFVANNAAGGAEAKQFATDNIVRPSEPIYRGSGVTIAENENPFYLEPALRAEWEFPLKWKDWLYVLSSFEIGYALPREIAAAGGQFRYQNPEAPHAALTDLTYTGSLSVVEQRFSIMPMLGLGVDYTNAAMGRWRAMHLVARLSLGAMLATGARYYSLSLAPQYVAAVNDTYAIKSEMVESYRMALLPSVRLELGARVRLHGRLHAALLVGASAVYGNLAWESQGYFAERAGDTKTTYQKIVSGVADQVYWGIAPTIFLALSTEL